MRIGSLVAALGFLIAPAATGKDSLPPLSVPRETVYSDATVVGTVTSFEKELVEVKAEPDSRETTAYTVAIVKIDAAYFGAKNATHIKVGFERRAEDRDEDSKFDRSRLIRLNNLAEKGAYLFFLKKHHTGGFYVYNFNTPPLPITDADGQKVAVAEARISGGALTDPLKALKAEEVHDRSLAVLVLLYHYRQAVSRGQVELVPLADEESAAILKAIADGDWTVPISGDWDLFTAFQQLNLTVVEGWRDPKVPPGANAALTVQKAFRDWLAGPGKNYRVHKSVLKKKD